MAQMWTRSNECISSIFSGLDAKRNDYIIAVGGSGDQSFALVQYSGSVLAVDIEDHQVYHMERMREFINKGDFKGFMKARIGDSFIYSDEPSISDLNGWEMKYGTKYFTPEIFENIGKNIGRLEIRQQEVFDAIMTEEHFNKIYLSNALEKPPLNSKPRTAFFREISKRLPKDGLIYIADGIEFYGRKSFAHSEIIVDTDLTEKVKNSWDSIVLRKI